MIGGWITTHEYGCPGFQNSSILAIDGSFSVLILRACILNRQLPSASNPQRCCILPGTGCRSAESIQCALHRIASYLLRHISTTLAIRCYKNQQAQANCIKMEIQWVREAEEDAHLIPSQLAGPVLCVFHILLISDLALRFPLHIHLMQASLRDTWQHYLQSWVLSDTSKRRREDWIWNGDIENKWNDLRPCQLHPRVDEV